MRKLFNGGCKAGVCRNQSFDTLADKVFHDPSRILRGDAGNGDSLHFREFLGKLQPGYFVGIVPSCVPYRAIEWKSDFKQKSLCLTLEGLQSQQQDYHYQQELTARQESNTA